jgi:hypothetical protein
MLAAANRALLARTRHYSSITSLAQLVQLAQPRLLVQKLVVRLLPPTFINTPIVAVVLSGLPDWQLRPPC